MKGFDGIEGAAAVWIGLPVLAFILAMAAHFGWLAADWVLR